MGKYILDVTCGSRTIWFNKNHPAAIYCDKRVEHDTRIWKSGDGMSERTLSVDPDVVCDFTNLPFEDNSFFSWCLTRHTYKKFPKPHGLPRNTVGSEKDGSRCFTMALPSACVF